jgi:hypothetical protein
MKVFAVGDALTREGLVLAGIVIALALGAFIVLTLRTLSLPTCWNCGFHSVRRSHARHRPLDILARICFLYPHRCDKCLRRFYCFGSHRATGHSSRRSRAAGSH